MIQPTRTPPSSPPPAAPTLVVARRIGQQLVAEGRVRGPALDDALRRHAKDEVRPAWSLVAAGVIGEPEWLERVGSHFGLAQVRERVATAYDGRGRVELRSAPGQGTVIRIHLPAPNPAT